MTNDQSSWPPDARQGPAAPAEDYPHPPIDPFTPPLVNAAEPESAAETHAARSPATTARGTARAVREIVETLLLALVIFVGVRLVVLNFRVEGLSMYPNLDNREMLLVNRNVYFHFDLNEWLNWIPGVDRQGQDVIYPFHPPRRGDIIIFNPPVRSSKPYIKRVIGLPGERVTFANGRVLIDGQPLNEPYINGNITVCTNSRNCDLGVIPPGSIFVLGDNRTNSSDSRFFGLVSVNSIVGEAWFAYWPFDDIGAVPHENYPAAAAA